MRPAVIISLLLLAVATKADEKGHRVEFSTKSVKSDIFAPLRVNKTTVLTSECGKQVTEPLGILEQTFKKGSTKDGETCTWHLHAPPKHVVNIISVMFVLEEEAESSTSNKGMSTKVVFYDGPDTTAYSLSGFEAAPQERVGYFVASLSSKQDMVAEVKYYNKENYATQKVLINYEFLEYDKMIELLKAH